MNIKSPFDDKQRETSSKDVIHLTSKSKTGFIVHVLDEERQNESLSRLKDPLVIIIVVVTVILCLLSFTLPLLYVLSLSSLFSVIRCPSREGDIQENKLISIFCLSVPSVSVSESV